MTTATIENPWYSIRLKPGVHERHAPIYARKSHQEGHVHLSNGAYVNFISTVEECRSRYDVVCRVRESEQSVLSDRWEWELHR